ncbi:MAG TPA: energy transducer TonB [Terracidiphilus sp.]
MGLPDPSERSSARDPFPTPILNERPLWCELYENVRERLFPPQLPPLELTSQPVPIPDRMASNTNPWAVGTATVINSGVLALLVLFGLGVAVNHGPRFSNPSATFDLKDFPLFTPIKTHPSNAGGGGGMNDPVQVSKGRNPRFGMNPLAPVQVPVLDNPKLAVENSIAVPPDIKLPDNPTMATIGVHSSPNVTLISGGQGGPIGIGSGDHGGVGPGHGQNGWGPGADGIYIPGANGVTQPIPIFTPEAEFSDEARRQKYQGVCVISLIVDAQGNPQSPRVVQPLGYGLDDKALEAVRLYRFKPAKKDGKPVAVRMTVMVNFRLY